VHFFEKHITLPALKYRPKKRAVNTRQKSSLIYSLNFLIQSTCSGLCWKRLLWRSDQG